VKLCKRGSVRRRVVVLRSMVKDRIKIAARTDFFVFQRARHKVAAAEWRFPINFTSWSTITTRDTAERGCGYGGRTSGVAPPEKGVTYQRREMFLLVQYLACSLHSLYIRTITLSEIQFHAC